MSWPLARVGTNFEPRLVLELLDGSCLKRARRGDAARAVAAPAPCRAVVLFVSVPFIRFAPWPSRIVLLLFTFFRRF